MTDEETVYDILFEKSIQLIQDHPPELVAGCLMAIAQRLYKTHLSEEDYHRIMKIAYETHVDPYDISKGTLH